MDEFARRHVRAVTRAAVHRAGVAGILPTPLEEISRIAGITETIDISDVPPDLVARRPSVWRRVLGAVLYRPQIVVVDRSQGVTRGRFIEAHEITHKLLPAHETLMRLDDEARLFGNIKRAIEEEAEVGAAELLFQGDLFVRQALDFPVSLAAPLGLAPQFGASLTAAVRHYPDYHPDAVSVIVAGRFANGGKLPIWSSHESPSFRRRLGAGSLLFPGGIPCEEGSGEVAEVVRQALTFGEVSRGETFAHDRRGERVDLVVEAFFNRWVVMVLLSERRAAARISRRIDVQVV